MDGWIAMRRRVISMETVDIGFIIPLVRSAPLAVSSCLHDGMTGRSRPGGLVAGNPLTDTAQTTICQSQRDPDIFPWTCFPGHTLLPDNVHLYSPYMV